ncbi:unnamed protein product [Rhodiola kirilowii]
MAKCGRCCLHLSMRVVNLILNLCGIGMIIYSLWLQKKWDEAVLELPSTAALPIPWFIYACLGVGIVVCLTTLAGHMVANCVSNSVLCIYMISILSLLLLQGLVIITIFFKMDWASKITQFVDDHHMKLRAFLTFHLKMCRLIVLMAAFAQLNVVVLAVILWAVDSMGHSHISETPGVRHSFLDVSNSTIRLYLLETYRKMQNDEASEDIDQVDLNGSQSFISWLKGSLSFKFFQRPPSS